MRSVKTYEVHEFMKPGHTFTIGMPGNALILNVLQAKGKTWLITESDDSQRIVQRKFFVAGSTTNIPVYKNLSYVTSFLFDTKKDIDAIITLYEEKPSRFR